jgi:hypothetical protein
LSVRIWSIDPALCAGRMLRAFQELRWNPAKSTTCKLEARSRRIQVVVTRCDPDKITPRNPQCFQRHAIYLQVATERASPLYMFPTASFFSKPHRPTKFSATTLPNCQQPTILVVPSPVHALDTIYFFRKWKLFSLYNRTQSGTITAGWSDEPYCRVVA